MLTLLTITAQVVTKGSSDALIKAVAGTGYQASLILDAEKSEEERGQRELTEYRDKCKASALGLGLGIPLMLYGVMGGSMMVSSLTDRVVLASRRAFNVVDHDSSWQALLSWCLEKRFRLIKQTWTCLSR